MHVPTVKFGSPAASREPSAALKACLPHRRRARAVRRSPVGYLLAVLLAAGCAPAGEGAARQAGARSAQLSAAPSFPLSVSPDGRHLVDAAGAPFFMVGDAAQSAAGALTLSDWQSYIDTRVSQGFNTVNVNFLEHEDSPAPPGDRSGNMPFNLALDGSAYTSTAQIPDFTTPNDAYWKALEDKIAYAQSKGVQVSLALYMWGAGGWYVEVQNNSLAAATSLGTYLANGKGGSFGGFNKYRNVLWVWGADHLFASTSPDSDVLARLHNIAAAVRSNAPGQLMSGDWGIAGTAMGLATSQVQFRTYSDLESVYAYENSGGIVDTARAGYQYVPSTASGDGRALAALPTFLKETGYEGEPNPCGTATCVRQYGWTGILNGCTAGYWYGHRDVWDFAYATPTYAGAGLFPPYSPWTVSVNSTGAQDMQRLASLLSQIAWWTLVPSGTSAPFIGRTLIANGSDSAVGGPVSAAQARDGTLLVAYLPSTGSGAQTIAVDLRGMGTTIRARWWDPTTGAFTSAGSFANTASAQSFTTPGPNGAGDNDWLLVLDTGSGIITPLTVSPSSAAANPGQTIAFTATGGSGAGYAWTVATNASGASITATGTYTAGTTTGVTDVVQVSDSVGHTAQASVAVVAATTATAPAALTATATASTTIALTWTNTWSAQTGIAVERSTDGATFDAIATLAGTATAYTDTGLSAATTYWYRVRGTTSSSSSPYSNVSSATTPGGTTTSLSFVQVASAVPQSPSSTVSVTYSDPQTAGNLNVVVVGWNDATARAQSVTDSSGNVYQLAVGPTVFPGAATQSIYYAKSIKAASAGGNTVTVQFSTPAVSPDIRIAEYAGADQVNPFDGAAAATGNDAATDSGPVQTTAATDLLVGANLVLTGTAGPGTGYQSRVVTSPDGDILEDRIVTSTGSYSATAPLTSAGPWVMQVVAFRADTGGTTTPSALSIAPSTATTAPGGTIAFVASGGSGTGYAWSFVTNASGGTLDAVTGSYVAGPTGMVMDVILVSDSSGNTAQASVSVTAPGTPTAPAGLTASATGTATIALSWTNTWSGQTGIDVERSIDGTTFVSIASLAGGATSFTDTGLAPATTYWYRVAGTTSSTTGPYSNVASATTRRHGHR